MMHKKLPSHKNIFLILIAAAFAGFVIYLFASQYYPVAFVNNSPISAGDFNQSYGISYNYYYNSIKAAGEDVSILKSDDAIKELKRATLDALVDQKLIDEELQKRINPDDLNRMIRNKLSSIDFNSDNFKKGSLALYGFSVDSIKKFVLIPKEKEEILAGRLVLDNNPQFADIDDWLKQKKSEAKVEILISQLYWNNGEVAAR